MARSLPPGWLAAAAAVVFVRLLVNSASAQSSSVPHEAATADAPSQDPRAAAPTAVTYGPPTIAKFRFGAKVVAAGSPVSHVVIVMAVPLECPEQQYEQLGEDKSKYVESVKYRQPDEGVRQMVITIRDLPAGEEAHAYTTFEVRTRTILPPRETASLTIPKKPDRELRPYLGASPMIDVKDRRIRAAVDDALKPLASDANEWKRVEAFYDYALAHIKYELGDDKSSLQALADGKGDCQALSATFVAMCRTFDVPARMVWVAGHQYAEFYLESSPGHGAWYPIESAGTRDFGGMPLARVILQKGDSIRVPERRSERLRYASDFAVFPSKPQQPPAITFVREPQ